MVFVAWLMVIYGALLPSIALGLLLNAFSIPNFIRLLIYAGLVSTAVAMSIATARPPSLELAIESLVPPVVVVCWLGDRIGRILLRPRSSFRSKVTFGFKRAALFVFFVVLLWVVPTRLTTWFPFTLPFEHPEQDACEFGPVTNAQYREMLARARADFRWQWLPELGQSSEPTVLKDKVVELTKDSPSPYLKIAASHAVLRSIGAVYRNNNQRDALKDGDSWSWSYSLSVPRLGTFAIVPGQAWLVGGIDTAVAGNPLLRQGKLTLAMHFPHPFDQIPDGVHRESGDACPSVPSETWAKNLEGPA